MRKILANDGIDPAGKEILSAAGFEVVTEKIAQEDLADQLKNFEAVLVRSATQISEQLIDAAPQLKAIGRAGVGMDNIAVDYARNKGISVINTPAASSESVAELVFAHMFGMARFLHRSNREMPISGEEEFSKLKKSYSKGIELRGKTLGIIGFGRIGQAVARIALGMGMNILPFKLHAQEVNIEFDFFKTFSNSTMNVKMNTVSFDHLLAESDFITLHVPFPKGAPPVLSKKEIAKMKDGVYLINSSRGGVIVEDDLLEALDSGKVAHAALDVFVGEPKPQKSLLTHPRISLSPHVGASTAEAQKRVGVELAEKIVSALNQ